MEVNCAHVPPATRHSLRGVNWVGDEKVLTFTVLAPLKVNVGAVGALGTLRMLLLGLAAVAEPLPLWKNLACMLYNEPALVPESVRLVCQAPEPLRYWVVQPLGAVIALTVIEFVALLSSTGALGAAGAARVLICLFPLTLHLQPVVTLGLVLAAVASLIARNH